MEGVELFLYLPPLPKSLSFRPHGSPELLGGFVEWFRASSGGRQLHVVVDGTGERGSDLDALQAKGARVVDVSAESRVEACSKALQSTGGPHGCFLELGSMFTTEDLIARTIAFHETSGNGVSYAGDVPLGARPEIAKGLVLEFLATLGTASPRGEISSVVSDLVRSAEEAGVPSAVPFRTERFAAYPGDPFAKRDFGTAPVRFDSKETVALAVETLSQPNHPISGRLRYWRAESVRRQLALLESLRRPASRVAGDKIRVLFASNAGAFAGAEAVLLWLLAALPKERFDLHVLSSREGEFSHRARAIPGTTVHIADTALGQQSAFNVMRVADYLRRIAPDAVHLNSDGSVPVLAAAECLGIPVIQHIHSAPSEPYPDQLMHARRVVAVSEFVRREAEPSIACHEKVRVITNGIDTAAYPDAAADRMEQRMRLDIPSDMFCLLMPARFVPYKRQDLLVRSVAPLVKAGRAIQVHLVGMEPRSDTTAAGVRELITSLGLEKSVFTHGFQPDLRPWLRAADLVALPSEREALSMVLIESLASGVPVIASSDGGSPEVIRDGETGMLIPAGDAKALTNAIEFFMDNPAERIAMGAAGRADVRERFDAQRMVAGFAAVYEEVVSGTQGG